jgi:hypothetical protein
MLLDIILTQWWRPVASSEALNLLYWAICLVTDRCISMAIKTASKVGVGFCCHLFACCPGGRCGNTEQVVDRWRHPGALVWPWILLHWEMPGVLLQHVCMAIKMASGGGTLVPIVNVLS